MRGMTKIFNLFSITHILSIEFGAAKFFHFIDYFTNITAVIESFDYIFMFNIEQCFKELN